MNAATAAVPAPSPTTPGITGYRNLSQAEKDLMNKVKAMGAELEALVDEIRSFHSHELNTFDAVRSTAEQRIEQSRLTQAGQHWRMRATDELQSGLMMLTRAVARPTSFA